ncbi:GNAT family N-acetyltransferase [Streptomyces ovatisporus]|uniref:Lysine N-acyltransferase MbtK n=1 Tax=Streptomyces ovatisporus TaxID=1128682 RepID=A0ABV9AET2_9ACTN
MQQPNRPASGASSNDDTLDLQLAGELAALLAEHDKADEIGRLAAHTPHGPDVRSDRTAQTDHAVPSDPHGPIRPHPLHPGAHGPGPGLGGRSVAEPGLLDALHTWPSSSTPVGTVRLVPVRLERDLRLITAWMNDPAVEAFWELSGPEEVTAAHLRKQLDGDGRSVPCLGVLDGVPMSYWEIYRADLDPIARYCQARPHDTGVHLLIGGVPDRGRGIGTALLRAVADLVLDQRPRCGRVLAEPDVRNVASVAAFLSAGFRLSAEVELPEKRAALMVRDRELREVL